MQMKLLAPALLAAFALQAQDLPAGKGKDILENNCSECHGADSVTALHQSRSGWAGLVDDMIAKGAQLTPDQITTVVDYLTANFGPPINVNKASAKDLVDGLGLTQGDADIVVKYRTDHGDFKTMTDLYKTGLDKAKLDAKKAQISF